MKQEKTTSQLIKEGLKKEGINAAELSRRTGIGKSSISHYMNGIREPEPVKREIIFKVLGIQEPETLPVKRERPPDSMTPSEAARLLGKGTTFIYEGLKDRRFGFGYAVKMPGGQWSYWIGRKKFFEETGIDEKPATKYQ